MTFKPGTANLAGRRPGTRVRLSGDFITALAADFAEGGAAAIKITRIENPDIYCRLIASILPREFTLEDNRMTDLSDEELDFVIGFAKRQLEHKRAITIDAGDREESAVNGKPAQLLQALPKAS